MTRATLALCFVTTLSTSLAPAARAAADDDVARYAIVIGYNGGDDGERPVLSFADDDAARFFLQVYQGSERAWLLTTFDGESARSFGAVVDQAVQPTRQELARVLGEASWLIRKRREEGRRTELVFYFAGHGDVSAGGEGFVVLADGPFTRTELDTQVVRASPAHVNHLVLDACASFHMVARGGSDGRVKLTPALLDVIRGRATPEANAAWERTGVLVSTSDAAEVHESAGVGGGVFSYLLRSALAGAADVNRDGRVEYGEAAGFIASASSLLEDPRARLDVHARAPRQAPHAALSDLEALGAEHFLVVDTARAIHLRVLDARGVPYAELHRAAGAPLVLALVGNPFYVVQEGALEAVLVPRHAGGYALSALSWDARQERAPRGRDVFAGLFTHPYGDAFLAGFLAESELAAPRPGARFDVAWAERGEPPLRVPWWPLAGTAFTAGGLLAVGAAGAALGNALAFAELQRRFHVSGTIDPALALEADAWLTGAAVLSAGALAALLAAGGLSAVALGAEEEGP